MVLDDENQWDSILVSTMFALRATVYTTTHYTPVQLIFGCNSIINWCHKVNLEIIRKQKQDLINKGNEHENCNWMNYMYKQGDKVLLKNTCKRKFNQVAYKGPYVITAVRNNGTVRAHKGRVMGTFNIQNLTPYKE